MKQQATSKPWPLSSFVNFLPHKKKYCKDYKRYQYLQKAPRGVYLATIRALRTPCYWRQPKFLSLCVLGYRGAAKATE